VTAQSGKQAVAKTSARPPANKPAARGRFGFFSNIIAELKKVTWPTRPEIRKLTIMVLAVALAAGLFLGAIDYGLSFLVDTFLLD
jgi:preprotein translocase subunit SecE